MKKHLLKLLSHRDSMLSNFRTAVRDVQNAEKQEAPEAFNLSVDVVDEYRAALLQISKFIDDEYARINFTDDSELRDDLAEAVEDYHAEKERADKLQAELIELRKNSVDYNDAAEADFDNQIHVMQQALNTERFNSTSLVHRLNQEKEILKDEIHELNLRMKQREKLLEQVEGDNIRIAENNQELRNKVSELQGKASELQDEVDILSRTIEISSQNTAKAA